MANGERWMRLVDRRSLARVARPVSIPRGSTATLWEPPGKPGRTIRAVTAGLKG